MNSWLASIHNQGHRVMGSRFHFYSNDGYSHLKAVFTVNDEPHPHSHR